MCAGTHVLFPVGHLVLFCLPSGYGVSMESGRSGVRIPLVTGFFRGRVIPVTSKLALQ